MPRAIVRYVDPTPILDNNGQPVPHWSKVEGPFQSFKLLERAATIEDISGRESNFEIHSYGFAVHH